MLSIFKKLISPPSIRSDRVAVYAKQDGNLYTLDGAVNIEKRIILTPVWPVGSVYMSVLPTNPAVLLGFGTWVRFAEGRTLVGHTTLDVDFDTAEEVGGTKTVTLTLAQMPVHTHVQNAHSHTQDSHNHTQNSHNHTQDAHNHTQNSHAHSQDPNTTVVAIASNWLNGPTGGTQRQQGGGTSQGATATNNANTATNQNTTATNQNATATNQNATATNQNAGGGLAHDNMPPYVVVYTWKRTA